MPTQDDTGFRKTLRVRYRYRVADREYEGHRVGPFPDSRRLSALYTPPPQGAVVPVYYHPRRPSRSVLQPGLQAVSVKLACVAAGVLAAGVALLAGWLSI